MTKEESYKLGVIARDIDGGCSCCVGSFTKDVMGTFPDIDRAEYSRGVIGDRDDKYWLDMVKDAME